MSIVETTLDQVFFFALAIESRPLEARLGLESAKTALDDRAPLSVSRILDSLQRRFQSQKVKWGILNGKTTAIVRTGSGRKNADETARQFLSCTAPSVAWSVGFAGALDPSLTKNQILADLVPVNRPKSCLIDVCTIDSEKNETTAGTSNESDCPGRSDDSSAAGSGRDLYVYSADRIVAQASEKARLFQKTGAVVVDMETEAIAQACEEFGVPLKCVRIVSDDALENLPPDLERLMEQKSLMGQMGAALGSIWKKPRRIVDLLALKANALESAEILANYLEKQ